MDYDPDLNWREVRDNGFNSHLGPVWFARTDDLFQGAIKLSDRHMNFGGVAHGGVYMALADVTMGIGAHKVGGDVRCATIDFNAHFLAAAKNDQWLICAARANRVVSGVIFMEAELWSGGRKCMRTSGIWKQLSLKEGAPPLVGKDGKDGEDGKAD